MMAWIAAMLVSLIAGWCVARALTAGVWASAPRWASLLVELSLAVLFGPGLASVFFFGMLVAGVGNRGGALAMLGVLLAGCAAVWWKLTPEIAPAGGRKRFPWMWALWICVAAGVLFLFLDFQVASSANPSGEWDAMSIWNLRARYLAAGDDVWRRAVSDTLGGHLGGAEHPGYPLFLSGFIGLLWSVAGSFDQTAPIVVSLMCAAAAWMLLGASVACRKSAALGLLAWCVLLASEVFASQTAAQYSDLLQGLAFLGAIVLLDAAAERDRTGPRILIAAGLAMGLACWIKNEGLPFMIAALAVAVWRFGKRGLPWLALGASPGLLATVTLKLVAEGHEAILPRTLGEALEKIGGAGRWWQAALGFGKAVFEAGNEWTHPVLLAVLLAFALRFAPWAERRARLWLWIPVTVTAAAEYGLYLVTTADLNWHISTSVSRLVAQLWPTLLWLFFVTLRTPEEFFEAPAVAVVREEKAGRRKTAKR
jgi:hypothetical protein